MRVARVNAQAKINLALQVHPGRDRDGYHELTTIFQRIDLSDSITVRLGGSSRSLDATGPALPAGGIGPVEKNLAYRAADEYLRHAPDSAYGFAIELVKNVPVGGGLGGGSADAAGVLRLLDALAPQPMDGNVYGSVAASLGADVPFLAGSYTMAMGTGRGDQLTGLEAPPPADVLLLIPRFSVATAEAYRWLDEDREEGTVRFVHRAIAMDIGGSWDRLTDTFNDFEPVVERRHPELRTFRERLSKMGARIARMSGSGSCVFGLFDEVAPDPMPLGFDAEEIATNTSARVVEVEVLQ